MDKEKLIEHINNSISSADLLKSKLNQEILDIPGFSSNRIRHLLNNIMSIDEINYLEIGTFKGSTFASALYQNSLNEAYAIDDWTEFRDHGDIKKEFLNNTKDYSFTFFEEDCFKLDLSKINKKINIFLYDGNHTYESHYNALKYYYPILDDQFIFIVDDYDSVPNWEQVQLGTQNSIKDLNLNIIYEKHLKSNGRNAAGSWWNGYYIALLKK